MELNETHRLGAELELVAHGHLHALLSEIEGAVSALRNSVEGGLHTLWLELVPSEKCLDEAISRYAALFDALPPELQAAWNSCDDRCVNVGVQAGFHPHAFPLLASRDSISELARLGIRLKVTLYAPDPASSGI